MYCNLHAHTELNKPTIAFTIFICYIDVFKITVVFVLHIITFHIIISLFRYAFKNIRGEIPDESFLCKAYSRGRTKESRESRASLKYPKEKPEKEENME